MQESLLAASFPYLHPTFPYLHPVLSLAVEFSFYMVQVKSLLSSSLIPRPPLAAFSQPGFFSTAAKKVARVGLGTRLAERSLGATMFLLSPVFNLSVKP